MRKLFLGFAIAAACGTVFIAVTTLSAFGQEPAELFDKLDANKDGVITSDEVPDDKQATFERLVRSGDANGDKKLTKDELVAGLKKLQPAADAPAATERPGGRPGAAGPGGAGVKEIFSRMDRDGNGKLEKDEIPERMKENLARIDANGDGVVELAEFEKVAQFFPGQRPEGAAGGVPNAQFAGQMFDRMDANSDGKLTKDEIPEERRGMFDRVAQGAGATGDSLTKEQFVKGMTAMAQNTARPNPGQPEGRPGAGGFVPGGPVLRALDADGDGEISASEIADATKALAKLDRNGDGKLTRDEIGPPPGAPGGRPEGARPDANPAGRPAAAGGEEFLKRLLEADKNGDKKISKEEAPDRLKENFDRADRNGDGQLDEAELKEMVGRIRNAAGGDQPRRRPGAEPRKE